MNDAIIVNSGSVFIALIYGELWFLRIANRFTSEIKQVERTIITVVKRNR